MYRLLNTTALVSAIALMAPHALAAPENGVVTAGAAAISQSGTATTITQSSDRAIIRWDRFNLTAPEQVTFVQPGTSSVTVNRIADHNPSQIDGKIQANGRVVLINPNGIVFGAGSKVDVAGLVATTSDLQSDQDFMAGGAIAFTAPGNPDAKIINHGTITAKQAGLVGLVAPHVENHGVIEARLGKVQLASGDIHTIDFAGDGLIKLEVSEAVAAQTIRNTGRIEADGGAILITAAQARHAVDALIENSGTLRANTIGTQKGKVTVTTKGLENETARKAGTILNEGVITAAGQGVGEAGGDVTILADLIALTGNAAIDVSGDTDGGTIHIGGDYQGQGELPLSDKLYIGHNAILNASSRRRGDGGTIILWSDDITRFYGQAMARGGAEEGNGGFIEVSGKRHLDYQGFADLRAVNGQAGVLLLDPTDIVISNGGNNNVSGASPFEPTLDDGPSVLNVTTLQNALASGAVIVQTRASGSQPGTITVDNAINWVAANNLTLDAHHDIVINAAISGTGMTLIAGNDVQLNANISGNALPLFIQARDDAGTIGIGDGQAGTLHLSDAELARIIGSWSNIQFGSLTGTGDIHVGAATWTPTVVFRSDTGVIHINGDQNTGATGLTIRTNVSPVIHANLIGTSGNLVFTTTDLARSIGIGNGAAGDMVIDDAALARIAGTWTNVFFGTTSTTGDVEVANYNVSQHTTLRTLSGTVKIDGPVNTGTQNLSISTAVDPQINGTLTGSGTLTITPQGNNISMGFGDGQTGTIHFSDQEIANMKNGWSNYIFGTTNNSQPMNIGASSWDGNVTFRTGNGLMSVNGLIDAGANNLTLTTNSDLNLGAEISGEGVLTISGGNGISIGLAGEAGTLNLTIEELDRILDGWSNIIIGGIGVTAQMRVGAYNWRDSVDLRTGNGALHILGDQDVGENNLVLRTNNDNLNLSGDLIGNGILSFIPSNNAQTIGIGDGQAGTFLIDNAELDRIIDGWNLISFGNTGLTGAMHIGARDWSSSVRFLTGSGAININGVQNVGENNLTIFTGASPVLNADLVGSGTLLIQGSATTTSMGIGTGQAGTVNLSNAAIARFVSGGWDNIIFGRADSTAAMAVGQNTWDSHMLFRSATGIITIAGAQDVGAHDLTFETRSNLAINDTLTGSGILTIMPTSDTSVTMGVNSNSNTIRITTNETNLFTPGWSEIVFGSEDMASGLRIDAGTWQDNVRFVTKGQITVNGLQTVANGKNMIFQTNADLVLNGTLSGTGNLVVQGADPWTTIGLGDGQAGTLSFMDIELGRILDGWSSVLFGRDDATGDIHIGANTWNDPVTFLTGADIVLNGIQTTTEIGGTPFVFATTGGAFVNTVGDGAIDPGDGRYLIYSVRAGDDTLDGLVADRVVHGQTWLALPPSAVTQTGNVFLYSVAADPVTNLPPTVENPAPVVGQNGPHGSWLGFSSGGSFFFSESSPFWQTGSFWTILPEKTLYDLGLKKSNFLLAMTDKVQNVFRLELLQEED